MAIRTSGRSTRSLWDVKNGLVSLEGAREDYGVVIADAETLAVDHDATRSACAEARR